MDWRILHIPVFCLIMGTCLVEAYHCPDIPENGVKWDQDYKKGIRCILRCREGFSPSGCHVIKKINGKWNYDIPQCKEDSHTATTVLKYAGIGAVVAVGAPYAIAAAGFGAGGVAAGSLAAWLQTPVTAAGSWFAAMQSAGAAGMAATTQVGIGTGAAGAYKAAKDAIGLLYCERE